MSTEPTTEMMNEAICTFMGGYRKIERQDYFINVYKGPDEIEWETGKYLKYHTSWDWLMPVVEKIECMEWCVRIENWPKKFNSPYKELYSVWMWLDPEDCPEIQTYSDSKIEAVHKAVYQFIAWYQSNKK